MSNETTGLIGLNMNTFRSLFPNKGVEESYQKALGALVIEFSLLTFLLESFSREVFALTALTAKILLNDLPFTGMIRKLRECTAHRIPSKSDQKEFLSILKKAEQAAIKRNELLHALWIINEGEPVFCYRRRNKEQSDAPSIGEINELTRSTLDLAVALSKFRKRNTLSTPAVEAISNTLLQQKIKQP